MDIDNFFRNNLLPAGFAADRAINLIDKYAMGDAGYKTSIAPVDRHLSLVPGEYIVIGARPSTGKTALGMQIVSAVLSQLNEKGHSGCIAVFSAEMSGEQLLLREVCAQAGVSLDDVREGKCTAEQRAELKEMLKEAPRDRLYIDESPAPTIEHMVTRLQAVHSEVPVKFVMFDYVELSGEFARSEGNRVNQISRALKGIAKQLDCPVLALSQLNRDIEGRADKKPRMSDLMYGGERDPDVILLMFRPWLYDDLAPENLIELHLAKYRNGRANITMDLFFDSARMRFFGAEVVSKPIQE